MLPNNDLQKIIVYPNEYVTNITINRGIARLLENDLYLEGLTPNGSNAGFNTTVPTSHDDPGTPGQWAVDSNYVYFCISDNNWGRVALDTSF